MRKRILAILFSALLVGNISSCNFGSKSEIEEPFENIDTAGSNFEEIDSEMTDVGANGKTEPIWSSNTAGSNFEEADEKTTDSGANTETKPPRKCPGSCNGVWGKSGGTYTFNQNGNLSVHIADWGETHLFTSIADEDIAAVNYYASSIGVNNERAFLVLNRYYENKITVVSFKRGSQSETVVTFDVDKAVDKISGNLIDENVGYLFAFEEKDTGGSTLSGLFKTEDRGKTWNSINVQSIPSIGQREYIMFARMVSEEVGLISGNVWGYDYNFCERTLLTTDGGLNWVNVNIPELPQDDNLPWAVVTDFSQIDGFYILTIRYSAPEGTYDEAKYKLLDSNTWVRIS